MADGEDNRTPDKKLTVKIAACARQETYSLSDEYLGEREVKQVEKEETEVMVIRDRESAIGWCVH